jgi:hypothetical protein
MLQRMCKRMGRGRQRRHTLAIEMVVRQANRSRPWIEMVSAIGRFHRHRMQPVPIQQIACRFLRREGQFDFAIVLLQHTPGPQTRPDNQAERRGQDEGWMHGRGSPRQQGED